MYDMISFTPYASDSYATGPESHNANKDESAATLGLQLFRSHPLLSDVVEDIWDWDLPDAAMARSLTMRLPPSAYAYLLMQYRVPLCTDWTFGIAKGVHLAYRHLVVRMQADIMTVRPNGPIGTVIVRIRPEASDRLTSVPLSEFRDHKIDLREIFNKQALTRMEEALGRAPNAVARVALVEELLLHYVRPARPMSVLAQAASILRVNPSMSVKDLASQLDISVRHLSRGFKAAYRVGPKQFARLVRVEKAVAARRGGLGWTEIAHACGFADQAHLIHDFRAIIGAAPEEVFRPPGLKDVRRGRSRRPRVSFNLLVG